MPLPLDLLASCEKVRQMLRAHSPVLIAYSGGVDSATLLALAASDADIRVQAALADSASLPRKARDRALAVAEQIGVTVRILKTEELENANYAENPLNRCYFCKAELFRKMERLAKEEGFRALAYGENADDLIAERPGSLAAKEFSVLAPLRAAGLGKKEVRQIARAFDLAVAEAPAAPCLSSRIPHGTPVTKAALAMIEEGEEILRDLGFRILRVRHLVSESEIIAKVQVAREELPSLQEKEELLRTRFLAIGYRDVHIDPAGYQGAGIL